MLNHNLQISLPGYFRHSVIGIFKLFVIWCLVLGIFTEAYALNLEKAKVCFLNEDYKAAILEAEKVLAVSGYSRELDELYYILGLSYLKEGNYLRSSDIFEIVINEFKGSSFEDDCVLGLGDTYFLKGDYVKAANYYKALMNKGSGNKLYAQACYRMSECSVKLGDVKEAAGYLGKLKSNFPSNIETKADKDLSGSELKYTVQVGVFSRKTNAEQLLQKLVKKGYPAYIEEIKAGDKAMHRVRVGKFSSQKEAILKENELSQEGYPTKIFP